MSHSTSRAGYENPQKMYYEQRIFDRCVDPVSAIPQLSERQVLKTPERTRPPPEPATPTKRSPMTPASPKRIVESLEKNLQYELGILTSQVEDLTADLAKAAETIAEKDAKLAKLTQQMLTDIGIDTTAMKQKDERILELERDIAIVSETRDEARTRITDLEKRVTEAEAARDAEAVKVAAAMAEVESLRTSMSATTTQDVRFTQLTQKLAQEAAVSETMRGAVKTAEAALTALRQEYELRAREMRDAREALAVVEKKVGPAGERVTELETHIAGLERSIAEDKKKHADEVQALRVRLATTIAERDGTMKQYTQAATHYDEEMNSLRDIIKELRKSSSTSPVTVKLEEEVAAAPSEPRTYEDLAGLNFVAFDVDTNPHIVVIGDLPLAIPKTADRAGTVTTITSGGTMSTRTTDGKVTNESMQGVRAAYPWSISRRGSKFQWIGCGDSRLDSANVVLPMGREFLVAITEDKIHVAHRDDTVTGTVTSYGGKVLFARECKGHIIVAWAMYGDAGPELYATFDSDPQVQLRKIEDVVNMLGQGTAAASPAKRTRQQWGTPVRLVTVEPIPVATAEPTPEQKAALELIEAMTGGRSHAIDIASIPDIEDRPAMLRAMETVREKLPGAEPTDTLVAMWEKGAWLIRRFDPTHRYEVRSEEWKKRGDTYATTVRGRWVLRRLNGTLLSWNTPLPSDLQRHRPYPIGSNGIVVCTGALIATSTYTTQGGGKDLFNIVPGKFAVNHLIPTKGVGILAAVIDDTGCWIAVKIDGFPYCPVRSIEDLIQLLQKCGAIQSPSI